MWMWLYLIMAFFSAVRYGQKEYGNEEPWWNILLSSFYYFMGAPIFLLIDIIEGEK